jgi:hypothetical protein
MHYETSTVFVLRARDMWVMLITFISYGGTAVWLSVSLSTAEFSSKATCEAAKTAYLAQFKTTTDDLTKYIQDQRDVGQLRGPNGVLATAVCVEK